MYGFGWVTLPQGTVVGSTSQIITLIPNIEKQHPNIEKPQSTIDALRHALGMRVPSG